ncbi:HAD-superfamily hydrolase [Halalkalibacter wakoensis JCM 9140]|uniref:HAD-superfamily hydrolase n=1 Tax=Halalkalibacter wakoensis JCM 9140 TaxID=1236970 RepID=W4Q0X5_9BACI|nr:HAD-IIIA family hydrolase [Halalkalibacter wakoensis]GAE25373.1 HAD-superfamily hydrolase [Halalkalibacter wakoensis JCM 9140]
MRNYVIFDFDGTLADSRTVFISAWNALADKFKFRKISREDLSSLRKLSIFERMKYLNFPIVKTPFILPDFYRFFRKYSKEISLYPKIKEMLDLLERKGYNIVILSSNSEDVIKDVLQRNSVKNVKKIMSSKAIFGKDQMIRQFLKDHQLKTSEVIYVGDEQRDILACQGAGVKIIWVSWGYDGKELVLEQNPDYLVDSPEEIVEVVLQHTRDEM